MSKLAFITGITGQDGSYLTELLLEKDYKVYGIVRRNSAIFNYKRIDHLKYKIQLIYADLIDGSSIQRCFTKILDETPEFSRFEVYNLAAQSHVHISYENPEYTSLVDGIGTLKLLEVIMTLPKYKRDKLYFYQAGQVKCMVIFHRFHKMKIRHLLLFLHMLAQRYTHII